MRRSEFVSVIGPSGAGKSTLLRCVNRLIDPTEGSVTFDGVDVTGLKGCALRQVRRRISMVFQHYNLVYRATSIENVLQGRLGYKSAAAGLLGLYTEEEKRAAFEVLAEVGLADFAYTRTDQLSGGQKQRVGIARALVQDPLLVRAIASLFRNIPTVAWAFILLFSFKQSDFTGFLALFLTSFGYLVRCFLENIDELAAGPVEALRAATAYAIEARANALLLASEVGAPARTRLTGALFERFGWGAGSAGRVADDAPHPVRHAYEARRETERL